MVMLPGLLTKVGLDCGGVIVGEEGRERGGGLEEERRGKGGREDEREGGRRKGKRVEVKGEGRKES